MIVLSLLIHFLWGFAVLSLTNAQSTPSQSPLSQPSFNDASQSVSQQVQEDDLLNSLEGLEVPQEGFAAEESISPSSTSVADALPNNKVAQAAGEEETPEDEGAVVVYDNEPDDIDLEKDEGQFSSEEDFEKFNSDPELMKSLWESLMRPQRIIDLKPEQLDAYIEAAKPYNQRKSKPIKTPSSFPWEEVYDKVETNEAVVEEKRGTLFGKYQFAAIVCFFVIVFTLQVLWQFKTSHKLSVSCKVSTVIVFGASIKDVGQTKFVSICRWLTCLFIHVHVFHLLSNSVAIITSWLYFGVGPGTTAEYAWIANWTFPLFIICGYTGSILSYFNLHGDRGSSCGASGGIIGLGFFFLVITCLIEGIPAYRRMNFVMVLVSLTIACVPLEGFFANTGGHLVDVPSHVGGALIGIIAAFLLKKVGSGHEAKLLQAADALSLLFVFLTIVAFLEVAREYIVDGKELITRVFVSWLDFDSNPQDIERRTTAPGRIFCDLLTDEYLYLLQSEQIEDDPELIVERLEQENNLRRKTEPPLGTVSY